MSLASKSTFSNYKINVKKSEDTEGKRCSELLQLLERHKREQLGQGQEEEEEEEEDHDDGDNDEGLTHNLKTQCNVSQ